MITARGEMSATWNGSELLFDFRAVMVGFGSLGVSQIRLHQVASIKCVVNVADNLNGRLPTMWKVLCMRIAKRVLQ